LKYIKKKVKLTTKSKNIFNILYETKKYKMKNKIEKLKAISEPNRIRILMMLRQKPLCACEITAVLGLSTATVSKHLSVLNQSGLVKDTKDGKWINYSLTPIGEDLFVDDLISYLIKWFSNENLIKRDFEIVKTIDREELICSPNKCSL